MLPFDPCAKNCQVKLVKLETVRVNFKLIKQITEFLNKCYSPNIGNKH